MRKSMIVVLVVACVALFGSLAVAGDDWQDGFAKALDQTDLSGAMTLAYNSQVSPQAVYEALEAFGVDREELNQNKENLILAGPYKTCEEWQDACCPAASYPCTIGNPCASYRPDGCLCPCEVQPSSK